MLNLGNVICQRIGQTHASRWAMVNRHPCPDIWYARHMSVCLPYFLVHHHLIDRQLSLGPEAALSLLIGQMISDLVYGDPHSTPKHPELEAAAIALVTTFQVGIITLGLGLLRLGFLDVVLSRALLRGFITAVGVVSHLIKSTPASMLIKLDHLYRAISPDVGLATYPGSP